VSSSILVGCRDFDTRFFRLGGMTCVFKPRDRRSPGEGSDGSMVEEADVATSWKRVNE